jgi:hypothetical protein
VPGDHGEGCVDEQVLTPVPEMSEDPPEPVSLFPSIAT